jgi:hypothetical protein
MEGVSNGLIWGNVPAFAQEPEEYHDIAEDSWCLLKFVN